MVIICFLDLGLHCWWVGRWVVVVVCLIVKHTKAWVKAGRAVNYYFFCPSYETRRHFL